MASVAEIADRFIEEMATRDPIAATAWGVAGHDDALPDLSPDGLESRAQLARDTLAELRAAGSDSNDDRIAAEVMDERLAATLSLYDSGDDFASLRVLHSPHGTVRQVFDLMAFEDEDDWQVVAARLEAVPAALAGFRATLGEGLARGLSSAKRQVLACITQCETWGGLEAADTSFFAALVRRYPGGPSAAALQRGASTASQAYLELGAWLRSDYLPAATTVDAVGRERYALAARAFTGADLDLEDTYAFGWAELARIEARMTALCQRIAPGATLAETIERLEADPALVIDGVEAFQQWNQQLIDTTIAELGGVHFDIAEPIRRCEAMIAPPGGAAAMYYTGPSEDFSRPGRTWYPTLGKTRFALWREVSICYHEGVPGHHLQVSQVRYRKDRLNRFQRLAGFTSGHGEGWALYAERLMGELGYLDNPAFELGMLSAQAMRAVRIVVDIGMHLELSIPTDERYHPGERWTPELALPFVIERSCFPPAFMASEVDRYLGLPGQAISYKVGERVWLESRDRARARHGEGFVLKDFHRYALDLGGMGLDQLARELDRYSSAKRRSPVRDARRGGTVKERHLVWVPAQGMRVLGETPEEAEVCELPSDPLADPRLEEVEFLVLPFGPSFAEVIAKMSSLKVVQTISTGVDSIIDTVPDHIVLCSGRGSSDTGVSEWTVGAILAGLRHLAFLRDEQVAGRWTKKIATMLADCTVLLLGYGSIAKALESRLVAFGPKIERVARQARPGVNSLEALERLLPVADVVVVLLPLTPETHHLVDGGFLSAMKDGALLVNPARGAIVDSDDLLAELQSGRLRAVIDVTDPEPLPEGDPLYAAPGLLLTPHVAGVSGNGSANAYRLVTEQIGRFVRGEPLLNVVHDGY